MVPSTMAQSLNGWNERNAREVVTELLRAQKVPAEVETQARARLEAGDPIQALKLIRETRTHERDRTPEQ